MDEKNYTVYYNAVRAKYATYLIAFGWCYEGGWIPLLQKEEETSNFLFKLEKSGENDRIQVITPFAIAAEIPDSPKSIFVKDDYSRYQVQVNGVNTGKSGENTSGKWVESGK